MSLWTLWCNIRVELSFMWNVSVMKASWRQVWLTEHYSLETCFLLALWESDAFTRCHQTCRCTFLNSLMSRVDIRRNVCVSACWLRPAMVRLRPLIGEFRPRLAPLPSLPPRWVIGLFLPVNNTRDTEEDEPELENQKSEEVFPVFFNKSIFNLSLISLLQNNINYSTNFFLNLLCENVLKSEA